jgi:glycosidase
MDSITKQMWNLIGSHDTQRFLTECNEKIERMKLAIAFQFTYIGVPYIYYGDEIGLYGGEEPESRKCMIWNEEKQNRELFNFYKELISIRKNNPTLIYGSYRTLYSESSILIFERNYKNQKILVAINNNDKQNNVELPLNAEVKDLFTSELAYIDRSIHLDSMGFKIYKIIE